MSPTASLPRQFYLSEYWSYGDDQKIAFLEANLDDDSVQSLRVELEKSSIQERNRDIWRHCKATGTKASDVGNHFGGDVDHIRNCLNKTGIVPDQWLTFALQFSGLDAQQWLLTPRPYHCLIGMKQTVQSFQLLHESSNTEVVRVANGSILGNTADATRKSVQKLSLSELALLRSLFCDPDFLNQWLHLVGLVAFNFSQMKDSPALVQFLRIAHERAHSYLDPHDEQSALALRASAPDAAAPDVVLGRIAAAWNPLQLYWYMVEDSVLP